MMVFVKTNVQFCTGDFRSRLPSESKKVASNQTNFQTLSNCYYDIFQHLQAKHLKGQLDPAVGDETFFNQMSSIGSPVGDVTFFNQKKLSWILLLVT